MHHSEESPSSRRMSHPSVFSSRRGSGVAVSSEDHQPHPPSSPGPHHPPHSLSIPTVKKKSGFQITSVLPAQVSASANNSVADDTESYDDMDESHTEDLSSSDILDRSVSRATDTGVPERSSSEETLNSVHGGETPGITSPNEPVMHQGYMVNGVHHQKSGRLSAVPVSSGCSVQVAETLSHSATTDANAGTAIPATTASRFRVVKLDSNSEPFRKGRWSCTEYYEKDAPSGDIAAVASVAHRAVESVIQSEHETTSGSSSGSTLSGGGDVQHAQVSQPSAAAQTVLLGLESSSAPLRPRADYPANAKPPVSLSQSTLPPVEYASNVQIPPVSTAVSPRAALIAGLPLAQPGSPQMGISLDQTGPQLSSSSMPASAAQPLRAPAGPAYVTASQLEDAQRLLLQHHPLLSLPRLAAGGMAGLAGPTASDAAALGQDGGASAFAVSTGADEDSSSGASVVAIDNKIEQAMDLVKSHLMYAVREEVEVLKEQIKELIERNSQLEQENALLKNLASPEQLAQFQVQVQTGSPTSGAPPEGPGPTA